MMKIETKICVLFIILLLLGDMLFFFYFYHNQSELMKQNYLENRVKQTNSIACLCKEAIAGLDFDLLNNTILKLCRQKELLKAIVLKHPSQKILASTSDGEYGTIFKQKNMLRKKYKGIFYNEYEDAGTSEKIFQVTVPIPVAQKKWEIIFYFDKSSFIQRENTLKIKLILTGLIIFAVGSIFIFMTGKITARSYSKLLEKAYDYTPIDVFDVFALPDLNHNTILAIKDGINVTQQRLSPDEKKIINTICKKNQLSHILKKSSLDEVLTFELISCLIARGILEVK